MAEPPDFMDIEPLDDIIDTELGALLWISTLFSRRVSSIRGPSSGNSAPRFLN